MLGEIFQRLLDVKTKKDTGSFYTPKEIVHYMCTESLINYIANETKGEFGYVKNFVNKIKYGENIDEYELNFIENVKSCLETITVLDPAVGSGAFPLGMLLEIVRIKKFLSQDASNYQLKLQTIQNSIFGVDIQPSAVDITKLRLNLSLIVDEEISNRQINPKALPNLNYNICCGNTLISEVCGKDIDELNLNSKETVELIRSRARLFDAHTKKDKRELKDEILKLEHKAIKDILGKEFNNYLMYEYGSTKLQNHFFMKLNFPQVFKSKGGFDVVLGNPPYVGQKGNADLFDNFKKSIKWSLFYERKQDLYYYFIAQALLISNATLQVSYIIPPYFLTATGAQKLRDFISKNSRIRAIVNFTGNTHIFETANINSLILFLDNGNKKECINIIESDNKINIRNFNNYKSAYTTADLNAKPWNIFKGQNEIQINNNDIVPLSDIASITPGIQTGADKLSNSHISTYGLINENYVKDEGIYVLSQEEVSKFVNDELNFIKPMYKNSDISKWHTNEKNRLWMLITNEIDDISIYPNIKLHLLKYRMILDGRYRNFALKNADKMGKWWFLFGYRPNTDFNGEKIVNANRAISNVFSFSNSAFYSTMDVFYTILKNNKEFYIKYILAILNSKFILHWLNKNCKKKGNMFELITEPLGEIPIKRCDKRIQNRFVEVVDKILDIKKQNPIDDIYELEKQIDQMVYKLYGLTEDEIRIIEESSKY